MNDSEQPRDPHIPLTKNAIKTPSSFETKPATSSSSTKTARPRTWKTYAFWSAATLFCIVGALAGVFAGRLNKNPWAHDVMDKIRHHPFTFVTSGFDPFSVYDYKTMLPPEKQRAINVLILGCDHDYDDRTQKPILTTPGRSDSILIAHINFDAKTIKCLTIPRDTAVQIPDHRGLHKINAAHEFGDNALSVRTIKERFGLDMDYCLTLDFESFQKVVDAIGGVNVVVHKKLDYDDNWGNLHVHLKPGMQHLNGYHAMGYVRIRHSDSDLARSERQHEFIEALRQQVMTPGNFGKLPAVLNAVTSDLHTDLDIQGMLAVAKFAIKDVRKEDIQLITLPNYEGRSYCYIYQDKAKKVIADLFYGGNEDLVQLDLPNWEQVAGLNSGGLRLNGAGESVGGEAGSGRRRRRSARHSAATDASTPRDDTGKPLEPQDSSETQTDMTPTEGKSDENSADGNHARRKKQDNTDTSSDNKSGKDADGSSNAGSKDSSKDAGTKSDANSKGESKNDSGKSESSGDKNKGDSSGDKSKGDGGAKSDPKPDPKPDTKSGSGDTL